MHVHWSAGPDNEDSDTLFRLDGNTGQVWAAQLRPGVYRLLVAARDGSGYEAAQVAKIRVGVLAADAAVFVKPQYSFTVPEDAPVGTTVGAVAVSPDRRQSGKREPHATVVATRSCNFVLLIKKNTNT